MAYVPAVDTAKERLVAAGGVRPGHARGHRRGRWIDDDGYAFTAPVGSFLGGASPYGALDMAGNVWEWVADWYDDGYYSDSPTENPAGPPSGVRRVQRGGAWYDNQSWVRCTVRHATPPTTRADDLGFRCAVPAALAQELKSVPMRSSRRTAPF